jgi:hypothetical protein
LGAAATHRAGCFVRGGAGIGCGFVSTGDGVTLDEAVEELREQTERLQRLVRELGERVARLERRAAGEVLRDAPSGVVFRPD